MLTGAVQDVQRRLCSNDDDIKLYESIQEQLKDTEKRLAVGQEDLFHLKNLRMHVACDDPGLAIGMQLTLPILQVGCACCWWTLLWRTCCSLPLGVDSLVRCPI